MDEISVTLTQYQIESLLDFIEYEFIESIRRDDTVENMDYVCNISAVYKALQVATAEYERKKTDDNDAKS